MSDEQNNPLSHNGASEESFTASDELQGLLVSYRDDQLDHCVKSALKRKSRVKYRCMDTFSSLLAFGTSGGAIYLFRLGAVCHSSCELTSMIPCDQGSIEVIKFLPNPQTDDLFIAIGTMRGSLVIFKLSQLAGEESLSFSEIYRAESFTNNFAVKLMEGDHNLLDLSSPFTRLYISDAANRLYVLDSSAIFSPRQTLRLFYTSHLPALVFSISDSHINQISVHKSQLLISTDETTRIFSEHSNQLHTIGKKKRKRGFYGACFVNLDYRPINVIQTDALSDANSAYSSTGSLADSDNILMFVSRPMFRLWQVDQRREVTFTHQFDEQIRTCEYSQLIELDNNSNNNPSEPSGESLDGEQALVEDLVDRFGESGRAAARKRQVSSSHFHKLMQIYSSTLGNLLMSYTAHEIFIVDPIRAQLIARHSQEEQIVQVCSCENELFIWSLAEPADSAVDGRDQFLIRRLVLLAPTQFVLELHRLHRFAALASFVQLFSDLFRRKVALPLSGLAVLTTEGGLLRNILLNAWEMLNRTDQSSRYRNCREFQQMITEILEESRQLKQSLEDLANSRFFLNMTSENIDRLCIEPYASLVSLEVSIKDLHTKHVIHFNKSSLDRHKSMADLSKSLRQLRRTKGRKAIKSNYDLSENNNLQPISQPVDPPSATNEIQSSLQSLKMVDESCEQLQEIGSENNPPEPQREPSLEPEVTSRRDIGRCPNCHWPAPKSHLRALSQDQQVKLQWISDNLMCNFLENIEEIKLQAFKFGLWQIFLKCLAFNNQIDDYITCCMSLDDIRLIDIEQFIIIYCGETEVLDRLLAHLGRRSDFARKCESGTSTGTCRICLKCDQEVEMGDPLNEEFDETNSTASSGPEQKEDKFSFNLVNISQLFMSRKNADVRKIIGCLLRHPQLVNKSRISNAFYLKAIATATLKANQSQLNRARLRAVKSATSQILE